MTTIRQSTFIIIREDRALDPKTVISDGLRIGRLPESDIWLNHANISRLHAGINEIDGYFFLINLSGSSATTLNGRPIPFDDAEALTEGDEIQIGPYFLTVEKIEAATETLTIRVTHQFALNVGERDPAHKAEVHNLQLSDQRRVSGPLMRATGPLDERERRRAKGQSGALPEIMNALKVFWGKRTREKAAHQSPLHPQTPPQLGKARFNWTPTRDLVRPWPFAIFIWASLAVATLSVVAAFTHTIAFAPERVSTPHTRNTLSFTPSIATQPIAGSCTSCHALGVSVRNAEKMNAKCSGCHHTDAFAATITRAHRNAGLTCISCHTEHLGEDFRPINAALESCAKCHSDGNKNTYNGNRMHTAHGGTFGYPVKDATWIWKGLDEEELAAKPQVESFLKKNRVSSSQTQEWRNAQFHGIHLAGIRVVPGIDGSLDDDGATTILSCSSCHKTGFMGTAVDRNSPRTTCAHCHNAQLFKETTSAPKPDQTPSCTSCHVQHVNDSLWISRFKAAEGWQ